MSTRGRPGRCCSTLSGERGGDQFGSTVAGYSDARQRYLIVGAPLAGAAHHGRVYVYAQRAGTKFTIEADATGNALGLMFVSVPGDMDGDGVSEIFASDWSNDAHGLWTGRVYVYSGQHWARSLYTFTGNSAGDGFGTSASVAGDVDGDGRADLIVGRLADTQGSRLRRPRLSVLRPRRAPHEDLYLPHPGDTFGFDAVGLGDVDR